MSSFSIREENPAETDEIHKKNSAHLIQGVFNHFHEDFSILIIKNDNAINVINMSTRDLLIIIKNGINE